MRAKVIPAPIEIRRPSRGQHRSPVGFDRMGSLVDHERGRNQIRIRQIQYFDVVGAIRAHAASGDINHGIVAGIGAGAESFDDYAMSSICAEGSGANQLHYVLEEQPVLSWDAGTRTLTITHRRYMNNNSSAMINVTEIGIIANGAVAGGSGRKFMTARDVLTPQVEVPPSGQILASYILSLVYPS